MRIVKKMDFFFFRFDKEICRLLMSAVFIHRYKLVEHRFI